MILSVCLLLLSFGPTNNISITLCLCLSSANKHLSIASSALSTSLLLPVAVFSVLRCMHSFERQQTHVCELFLADAIEIILILSALSCDSIDAATDWPLASRSRAQQVARRCFRCLNDILNNRLYMYVYANLINSFLLLAEGFCFSLPKTHVTLLSCL